MSFHQISLVPSAGGTSLAVAVSTSSTQSAVLSTVTDMYINYYSDVICFMRQGVNPTAVANTDQLLPANSFIRIGPIVKGNKIALIATGAGTAFLGKESA